MPKITGPPKEKITIGFTPRNMKYISKAMANNEYSTISELVNDALTSFFEGEKQERNQIVALEKYLESEEGDKKMLDLMMRAMEKKLRGT